jgi:Rrf2 family protein
MFGARVEYALHTLVNLGLAEQGIAPSARDLARFQRLPHEFARKLLTELEKGGVVVAAEGVRGGWRLARPPAAITVLDVVTALHGDDELFDCRDVRAHCALWPDGEAPLAARSGVCEIHAIMLAAEAAMRRELAMHTLADITQRVQSKTRPDWADTLAAWFAGRYAERTPGRRPMHQEAP